jgi:uncharacterized membrane protein
VKVGLLASARQLQKDMNALALEADTQSPEGLSQLLQEVTLGLMRYSDYWAYGHAQAEKLPLSRAESLFYQASLQERSKFSAETLSNRNNQIQQVPQAVLKRAAAGIPDVGEYLVVTLLVVLTFSPVRILSRLSRATGAGDCHMFVGEAITPTWT